jgi:hypothetical protein
MVLGYLLKGPLAILRETWTGEPVYSNQVDLNKSAIQYLTELRERLDKAGQDADQRSKIEQNHNVRAYNRRTPENRFTVGELCLIFQNDSSNPKWKWAGKIVAVLSPYSYVVEYDSNQYHLHANKPWKFHNRVYEAEFNNVLYITPAEPDSANFNCAVIPEKDVDFGSVAVINPTSFEKPDALTSQRID